MKAPGKRAQTIGTKLKRGAAVQIVCYPRPHTKAALVEASRRVKMSLSSFMVLASLKEAAVIQGCNLTDLVPPEELRQYLAERDNKAPRARPRVQ
jgi:hypothetical protein